MEGELLTRDEVVDAGHRAWTESFYYDGIRFFERRGYDYHVIERTVAPLSGWRHQANCRCRYHAERAA